jgi:hypothetical protein
MSCCKMRLVRMQSAPAVDAPAFWSPAIFRPLSSGQKYEYDSPIRFHDLIHLINQQFTSR